jgi:hypothetical protein
VTRSARLVVSPLRSLPRTSSVTGVRPTPTTAASGLAYPAAAPSAAAATFTASGCSLSSRSRGMEQVSPKLPGPPLVRPSDLPGGAVARPGCLGDGGEGFSPAYPVRPIHSTFHLPHRLLSCPSSQPTSPPPSATTPPKRQSRPCTNGSATCKPRPPSTPGSSTPHSTTPPPRCSSSTPSSPASSPEQDREGLHPPAMVPVLGAVDQLGSVKLTV